MILQKVPEYTKTVYLFVTLIGSDAIDWSSNAFVATRFPSEEYFEYGSGSHRVEVYSNLFYESFLPASMFWP